MDTNFPSTVSPTVDNIGLFIIIKLGNEYEIIYKGENRNQFLIFLLCQALSSIALTNLITLKEILKQN